MCGRSGRQEHVIEQGIDTSTMEGRAMFGMLSVLAELQAELTVARTNCGLASARARGRVGGRRPKLTADRLFVSDEVRRRLKQMMPKASWSRPRRRSARISYRMRRRGVEAPPPRSCHGPPPVGRRAASETTGDRVAHCPGIV
ncbi:recombinase family protein [Streptomyces sp. A-14]|uniref:recombinase family protein n=1 Tax=Streptomyces sp. A-14 TaxID=3127467 RepID=UPI000B2C3133